MDRKVMKVEIEVGYDVKTWNEDKQEYRDTTWDDLVDEAMYGANEFCDDLVSVKVDGVEVENKLISTDTYAPIVQVKKVGVEPTMEGL